LGCPAIKPRTYGSMTWLASTMLDSFFFNNGLRLDDVTHGRWPRCVAGGRRRPEVSLPGRRSWGADECREVEKGLASVGEARLAPPCFEGGMLETSAASSDR
jgi:hypothetical protein